MSNTVIYNYVVTVPSQLTNDLCVEKQRIDEYLETLLDQPSVTGASCVPVAMRYAVFGEAQRIRPILSLRVARLFDDEPSALSLSAAASVELLHCASLIIDDLPCMDDAPMRRNRQSVHVAFGEATAVLAAFALVALAARSIVSREYGPCDLHRALGFQKHLLSALDCNGLIAGQALDLGLSGESSNRTHVTDLKTVPLFLLAARAGTLFAEPSERSKEKRVMSFAREFGVAFQMTDDFLDEDEECIEPLTAQLQQAHAWLAPLETQGQPLGDLLDYLNARAWEKNHSHR